MSNHPRRTITITEIASVQKQARAGVPLSVIAKRMHIREDCVENFLTLADKNIRKTAAVKPPVKPPVKKNTRVKPDEQGRTVFNKKLKAK